MEPHWPAVFCTAALRCLTLAVALRSSSFQVRSMSLVFRIPHALFSCLSLVCTSRVCPLSTLLVFVPCQLFLSPSLCLPSPLSPPTLFRFQFLRSSDKQRFVRLCGLSFASAPAPANDPLTHQILITTGPFKAWPSLPSTPISWSTAVIMTCLRGTCAYTRRRGVYS